MNEVLLKGSDMLLFSPLGAITPPRAHGVNFRPSWQTMMAHTASHRAASCLRFLPALGQGFPTDRVPPDFPLCQGKQLEEREMAILLLAAAGPVDFHMPK